MLILLTLIPIIGIISINIIKKRIREQAMIYSIITMYISFYLLLTINSSNLEYQYRSIIDISYIRISLGVDGISLSLILLTTLIIPILILLKENKEDKRIMEILLVIESMLILLFSVLDLFIFYILFELLLIPMFILIGRYGSKEKRIEAAYRFLIYSLLGSLIMLLSIIVIYIKYGTTNNELLFYHFNNNSSIIFKLFWLTFFISFAIKVPIFPFHTWLPFVHVEAPTIGSILLAAIMLKLGTYGIIRYLLNLFGEVNNYYMPLILILSLLSIIYCSITTIRQIDLKKIVAYSSIVHMNYAIIGLFTNDIEGIGGGSYLMISHAFISSGLFLLIGILYKRYHTRIILYYNGLVLTMPIYSTFFLLLTLANISLPLTSSFISEILILISTIKINLYIGILISLALIFSTVYGIWFANRLLFGQLSPYFLNFVDLTKNEFIALLPLTILTLILGVNSNILLTIYTLPILNLIHF